MSGTAALETPLPPYGASPIKRRRRTKEEMEAIREAIFAILAAEYPMTVRQVFYQLTSRGLIAKTENEYNSTVVRLLAEMRRSGEIPYSWITDSTRWMRKPQTHSNLDSMLTITASTYRRALWDNQPNYVEIWVEKEALAGVMYEITSEWDVPLMATKGYPSITFVYGAAMGIMEEDKPTYIYYFGDHDPSGIDIPRFVEEELATHAADYEVQFERVAVTLQQVEAWNLPARPTKRSDTRSKHFRGESVELDAIQPSRLRELVRGCIERHVDHDALAVQQAAEESEREILSTMLGKTR